MTVAPALLGLLLVSPIVAVHITPTLRPDRSPSRPAKRTRASRSSRRLSSNDDDESLAENCTLGYEAPEAIAAKILACENPEYRPVQNFTTTVDVRVNIEFFHLDGVDAVDGTATFNVWFRSFWTDEFMTWNSDDYAGIDYVTVDRDSMWLPDFVLYNSAEVPWYETVQPTRPWVYSDGYVWDSVPAQLKVTCNFEFSMFPHEIQTCDIIFGSWIYSGVEMDLSFSDPDIDGLTAVNVNDNFKKSTEWEVLDVTAHKQVEYYSGDPFPLLVYKVKLQRYVEWYLTNGVIPMTFATFVTFGSFWLDAVNQGERVGLCITALLTITAIHFSLTEDVPKSRYSTWLDRFMIGCFTFSFMATLVTLLVIYLALKKDRQINNRTLKIIHDTSHLMRSTSARNTLLSRGGSDLEMSPAGDSKAFSNPMVEDLKTEEGEPQRQQANTGRRGSQLEKVLENAIGDLNWKTVARSIDRIARVLFPVAFGVLLAIRFQELYSQDE